MNGEAVYILLDLQGRLRLFFLNLFFARPLFYWRKSAGDLIFLFSR